MASPEQSLDKSSNGVPSSSEAQIIEMTEPQSHVRVPESVLNIDEETRMGPEMTFDGVIPSSIEVESVVKSQEGSKNEATTSVQEILVKNPAGIVSFSALSFIAAEYAESESSSPRSTNSPLAVEEISPAKEITIQSSGFDLSVPIEQKDNLEVQSMSLDSGVEASASCSAAVQSQWVLDELTANILDSQKEKEVKNMGNPAAVIPQNAPDLPSQSEICSSWSQAVLMETEDSKEIGDNMGLSLKDNQDTMQSVTELSEDSKPVSHFDSVLSNWQEESLESSIVLKGPSLIPFGENANSSMPPTGEKLVLDGENSNLSLLDESSISNSMADRPSRPKRVRRSSITDFQDSKPETDDGLQAFPAERVFEYQWPQDGGEWYLLQEQISEYLGVLSFKRKYPDLTRRTCDKLEKDFLRERGVVTETQSDLGLTALRSDEVYDLMMKDYPEKYHEYAAVLHEREKQKISDKHKEYEGAQPKLEKSKMADYMKKAAKSAAEYNRQFLRERREERVAFFDLQTFMIHYPEGYYKKLPAHCTKPSAYPVVLMPGQYQDHYCSFTSDELRYFPLNTALYDPPKKMKNTLAQPAGSSESSSDDSSEDKNGSSSEGSSTGSGSSDSETPAPAAANGNTSTKACSPAPSPRVRHAYLAGKTAVRKPGRKPGRILAKPLRRLTGKGKHKNEVNEEKDDATAEVSTQCPPAFVRDKIDEEEDKDKCRICKNAVLFLKYKRVETKMVKCSECGKIAHPSCLDLTEKMVQVVSTYPWQCMECKTCVECMDPYDEDKMLFCDRCDRGYHTFCVGLRCLPSGQWECHSCKGPVEMPIKSRRGRGLKST